LWFKDACRKVGLDVPASALVNNAQDGLKLADQLGYPVVIRPSFTLGGTGGSIAYNREEFAEAISHALDASPVHEALVEESVLGWKEYELEVMRDYRDNFVVICSIENFDPMGVHTGDSITVAPAQTLTDKEYQRMRDAAAAIIREVGVETGGSNIQFAIDPATGRMIVIEMNPRVSRSSALASKATGFPIAKIGSDGDRTDVQGSAAEGHSLAGAKLTLARARGHARIAVARKNRHGASGQNSLAARRARAWDFLEGNGGADQNRSVVHPADARNCRGQQTACVRNH
jgi:pyruvate carboxylase